MKACRASFCVICGLRSLFLIDRATHSILRWIVIWIEMTKVASTVHLPWMSR